MTKRSDRCLRTRCAFAKGWVMLFNIKLCYKCLKKLLDCFGYRKKWVFLRIYVRVEKNQGKGQEFQCSVSMGKMPVFKRRHFDTRMWWLAQLGLSKVWNKKRKMLWRGWVGPGLWHFWALHKQTNKQTDPAINISWWASRSREASTCCLQKSGRRTHLASPIEVFVGME